MKKFFKFLLILFVGFLGLILLGFITYQAYFFIQNSNYKSKLTPEAGILQVAGTPVRDLNKNGQVDAYEDPSVSIGERIEDLLAQMTLEEKAGMMFHPPVGIGKNGVISSVPGMLSPYSTYDILIGRNINHFNLFSVPDVESHARWYNELQKLAEKTRLGIPVTISSDPRHGFSNFLGTDLLSGHFSRWPEPIGLAATWDSALVAEFGRIAAREYCAVGIRTALHPMADLSTEPRWARINGSFGEDAGWSSKMTAAYIYGFQDTVLGPHSVACMTKHWPGGGPQKDGEDAHFSYGKDQEYPGNNFDYHLLPFLSAFQAGTAAIMPYYGVPYNQTSENVGMSFNKEIITDLLRNKYGYNGVVCTDWGILEGFSFFGYEIVEPKSWGVEDLSIPQRIQKAIEAGVDQFGGNANTHELIELIKSGAIPESRIDESVRRLLKVKFQLGLFDNPYVNVEKAGEIIDSPDFVKVSDLAQRKSIVLLKNSILPDSSKILPLKKGIKIYVENISREKASAFATVVDSLSEADVAILHLQTPWQPRKGDIIESFFHQGDLDFKEPELSRILTIIKSKPAIVCLYLDRAAVIPEIAENCDGLLAEFGISDEALLDVLFGEFNPTGRLPFELPSSMEAVRNQLEDVPYDSKDPLYPFGYGLNY